MSDDELLKLRAFKDRCVERMIELQEEAEADERERCAWIADEHAVCSPSVWPGAYGAGFEAGYIACAQNIAKEIRKKGSNVL